MEDHKDPDSDTTNGSPESKVDEEKTKIVNTQTEDAGPSRNDHLPGSTDTNDFPKLHRTGLSKSEHSINQIITRQDVENALKLTSMSFAAANPSLSKNINFSDITCIKNINLSDLKVPPIKTDDNSIVSGRDTIQRLMAGCVSLYKDYSMNPLQEVPVRVISTVINEVQELPNSSCVMSQLEKTKDIVDTKAKPNEVIVTNPIPNESKVSKGSEKKGSLSERSDLGLATRDSLSSIGSNVCRICMTRGRERLISPCNCKGSLANVHLSCLERWLNQVGRNHCELCGYSYPAIRTPRYTVLQALRLWFGNPRNRSHLQSDCLIFWLLSTVTAGLLAVCIVGTQYFVIEGSKFGISHRITETAMDFFMAVVLCGYSVTVYLLWKDHYVMWNRWRRANVNVRLLLSPDSSPVPFVPRARYNIV